MKQKALTAVGVGAACVACCAPLVAPFVLPVLAWAGLAGAGAAGGGVLAGLSWDVILCGGIAMAALAGGGIWLVRRRRTTVREGATCDTETCGPKDGIRLPD